MPDSDNSAQIKANAQKFGAFPDTSPNPSGPKVYVQAVESPVITKSDAAQVAGNQQRAAGDI